MTFPTHSPVRRSLIGLGALLCFNVAATAGDHGRTRVPLLPAYQQECGACHVAYPPGLLPAASWQRLMNNLPRHFGTDASLDAATTKQLDTWLVANAGTGKRGSEEPPQDRITRSRWFTREHDEISASTWKLPAVKSAANCIACHVHADKGEFNEHDVRIPR
ncbi:diheme cytochrome c [Herbaspirillum sp. ST 5-3]|uniref:diheme cytochrome c n=1 Tax=Oxalobacteraceae TaxID=75682 RepID=UPI0010A492C0|nr:diheme cytochrome c [Herbaspirillum sp. ST 5-3]